MKVLLLVFLIVCTHTFCVTASYYRRGIDAIAIPLMNTLEKKCGTLEDPKHLQHSADELYHCVSRLVRESPQTFDITDYDQDHCNYFNKTQLHTCFNSFTTNLSPCLAEDEIYLQQFLLDAFDLFYEELCGANGISNKEYIYDKFNRTGVCLQSCASLIYGFGSCNTAHLNIFQHLDEEIISLNKHDVCSDLKSRYKCITQLLEAVCNEEYSRLTGLVFHPLLKGCNDLEARK